MDNNGIDDLGGDYGVGNIFSQDSDLLEKMCLQNEEFSVNFSGPFNQANFKQEMNQFHQVQQQQQQQHQQLQPQHFIAHQEPHHQPQQQQQQQQLHQQQQQVAGNAHFSRIPDLVPIQSDYNFEVDVPMDTTNVVYTEPKLYIKMNSKMTINVSYVRQNSNESLWVRAMIIFSKPAEMYQAVKRCANHRIANSTDASQGVDAHILKINDPNAQYFGNEDGSTFGERLSVVVPLANMQVDENGRVKQDMSLEFACQNSCSSGINRRPTSIVFTLENDACKLIGKRAIEFKVCSCPKRDSERDQRVKKRKSDTTASYPRGKRPAKEPVPLVKQEPAEESETDSTNELSQSNNDQYNAPQLPMTTVPIQFPTEMVPDLLKAAFNLVAGKMAEDSKRSTNYEYLDCLKVLKKQRKDAKKAA